MAAPTPEQVVKQVADRFSRRFFWATIAIVAASWALFTAAVMVGSWVLAGLGALALVPAVACMLAAIAYQSDRMRRDLVEKIKQKQTNT